MIRREGKTHFVEKPLLNGWHLRSAEVIWEFAAEDVFAIGIQAGASEQGILGYITSI